MSCEPHDCYVLTHEVSDPKAETFQNDQADSREYTIPQVGEEGYTVGSFPAMREALEIEARRKMNEYPKREEFGCDKKHCGCTPSTDPKDSMKGSRRIRVSVTFTYPDGSGTASIKGSFRVDSTRMKGFCTKGKSSPAQEAMDKSPKGEEEDCNKRK